MDDLVKSKPPLENARSYFIVDEFGYVDLKAGAPDGDYTLSATVTEKDPNPNCKKTEAKATIKVTVKSICNDELENMVCVCMEECDEQDMFDRRNVVASKINHFVNVVSE